MGENWRLPELPLHLVEAANRFRIGDQIGFNTDGSTSPWIGDWAGTTAEVWGVAIDRASAAVNITLRHDGDQITDGFAPDDLVMLARRDFSA